MTIADGVSAADGARGGGHVVSVDTLGGIRSTVLDEATRSGLPEDTVTDLVLAVNELATNVVQHGGGTGTMWIWTTDKAVFCRVRDHGTGMTAPRFEAPEPGSVSGRGLWMIKRMADWMDIQTGPTGTTVTIAVAR